ncbi:MAG: DUF4158 domain-containing protein [Gammaproteobacteria bacterium]|nr:DUF4158 domain-containing protein [Gammaproteobacteria bacterium]
MVANDGFLSQRQRYQPIKLPQDFSDEEMARGWTLSEADFKEISKYRKNSRLFIAVQYCSIRLYGRFLAELNGLSPRIINYLNNQLGLPPSLALPKPEREATFSEYRKNILAYLGFSKFDDNAQQYLRSWLEQQAKEAVLPDDLFLRAERHLLVQRVILPGASVLERLVISVCADAHEKLFENLFNRLTPELKTAIDGVLVASPGGQPSHFFLLKEYPPSATIASIQDYLERYALLEKTGIGAFPAQIADPGFIDYLYKLARRYNARDMKRFKAEKRYAMMTCFLLETRKILLDHLVKMHDQFMTDTLRKSKHIYELAHRQFRKRQKKAINTALVTIHWVLDCPEDAPLLKADLWRCVDEKKLQESIADLHTFKRLEDCGYGDILLRRYASLRRYFADFIHLPFFAKSGMEPLLNAINIIRQLDSGELKKLPENTPITFIPQELQRSYRDKDGRIKRNAWELGVAIAMKEALRAGDLYLPQSKQHVSFWDLMLDDRRWSDNREIAYEELAQPHQDAVKSVLLSRFRQSVDKAEKCFGLDTFSEIKDGNLKLKKDDKAEIPDEVLRLQKAIDASLPSIRIEQLLMEVDQRATIFRES